MIRAIIVDDEKIVREGLRDHYHWSKYDVCVVGTFEDGKQADDFLNDNEVDLIVTDVVMPRMNGMELAESARKKYPDVKLIFVSGFTDAGYLLNALKLNATDFIFKSVDFDELDEAVERVVLNLSRSRQQLSHIQKLEKQVDSSMALLVQQQMEEKTGSAILGALTSGDKDRIASLAAEAVDGSVSFPSQDEKNNFLYRLLLLPNQILQSLEPQERGLYRSIEELLASFMNCTDVEEKKEFIINALVDASDRYLHTDTLSKPDSNAVVAELENHINSHYMDQISVTSLADHVRLSPAYMCVLFKQVSGQTINQYITKTRLMNAKRMLEDVSISIEEVCYGTGYLSTSYFSRLFKQNTGLTPSEYRNTVTVPAMAKRKR